VPSQHFLYAQEAFRQRTPESGELKPFNRFSNKFQAAVELIKPLLETDFLRI